MSLKVDTSSQFYNNYERNGRFGQLTIGGYPRTQEVGGPRGAEGTGSVANYDQYNNSLESGFDGVRTATLPGGRTTCAGRVLCYSA